MVPLKNVVVKISTPNPVLTCAFVMSSVKKNETLFLPCRPNVHGSIVKISSYLDDKRAISIGEFLLFGTRRE